MRIDSDQYDDNQDYGLDDLVKRIRNADERAEEDAKRKALAAAQKSVFSPLTAAATALALASITASDWSRISLSVI